jgi:hypothetical protein
MDLLRVEASGALPLANPVLTPHQLHSADAISEPTLLATPEEGGDTLHLFFAARACGSGRWGIAAARSDDGGMTWQPLGWVLQDDDSDLRAPTLFQHGGQVSRAGLAPATMQKEEEVSWPRCSSHPAANLPLPAALPGCSGT